MNFIKISQSNLLPKIKATFYFYLRFLEKENYSLTKHVLGKRV